MNTTRGSYARRRTDTDKREIRDKGRKITKNSMENVRDMNKACDEFIESRPVAMPVHKVWARRVDTPAPKDSEKMTIGQRLRNSMLIRKALRKGVLSGSVTAGAKTTGELLVEWGQDSGFIHSTPHKESPSDF